MNVECVFLIYESRPGTERAFKCSRTAVREGCGNGKGGKTCPDCPRGHGKGSFGVRTGEKRASGHENGYFGAQK